MQTKIDYAKNWYEKTKPNYAEFDADSDFWEMKYFDRFVMAKTKERVSVLDIGCGLGRALSYFKKFGAEVVGVEPSAYACEHTRLEAYEVINAYFQDAEVGKFDMVHIEQVLSHTPNYREMLEKAIECLKDDGVLVIEEPNDGSPLQKALNKGKYWMSLDHCNYWNFDSFKELIEDLGLKVIRKSCTWPMELFELQGDRYLGNELRGKEVHLKRTRMELGMGFDLRNQMKEMFASQGFGRDMVFYLKKGVE